MTEVKWRTIAAAACGTTDSPGAIAARYDVDEDDVEEMLSSEGVETCEVCGWWFAWDGEGDVQCEDCKFGDAQ